MTRFLACCFLFLAACTEPHNDASVEPKVTQPEVKSMRVHYMHWGILTYYSWGADDLQRHEESLLSKTQQESLLRELREIYYRSGPVRQCRTEKINGRLFVNVTTVADEALTFFADQFCVCELVNIRCVEVDQRFRERISSIIEE